ncbi:MAG: hypothetical protein ACI3XW_03085, partial [Butyricicoccus sp.]
MKCEKQLAALLLSITLLTGMAVPSFAEPETTDPAPAATQTTDDTSTDNTQPAADSDTAADEAEPAANTDAAEPEDAQSDT